MEISKEFLAHLESNSKFIDIHDLVYAGQKVSDAFPKLLEMGKRGEVAYIEWNGKKYYTFMSEDEMYMTMCGKNKAEVLKDEQAERERFEQKMEQRKRDCQKIKEEKFPGIKKSIEEFFPPETAEKIIADMLKELDEYHDFNLKRAETIISLLETAKTKPASEAVKAYMGSAYSPESRLYDYALLKKSYFGDVFMGALIADIRAEYGMHGEETVQKIIQDIMDNVQRAKEEYMKRQGFGNNLSEVLGDESSTKGKRSSKTKGA